MYLSLKLGVLAISFAIAGSGAGAQPAPKVDLPPATAIPVVFEHTIDAGKAKPGDPILAKTMETVFLPSGRIAKGTVIAGHVVEAQPFRFDPAPYATQRSSYLCIHFDKVLEPNGAIPLSVSVRALANRDAAYEASRSRSTDDTDHLGTMVLIGGAHFSPIGKRLMSPNDEDIVGYIHKQGVFARLLPADYVTRYGSFHCDQSQTEQAVGIFSPDACGVYGFASLVMTKNGSGEQGGNFLLEARHSTVRLYGGSAALLEVAPVHTESAAARPSL